MCPEVHIYSRTELRRPRVDLEDAIEARFGDDVEVAGGGQGGDGWNVDLAMPHEDADVQHFLEALVVFLRTWGVPTDTVLRVFERGWVEGQAAERIAVFDAPGS
jgi:hypothetical protein